MTLYAKLNQDFSKNYMANSVLGIILSTCIGSIAVMTSLMNGNGILEMILVFVSVATCSIHNASILTLQKAELVFKLLMISIFVNALIILGNGLF